MDFTKFEDIKIGSRFSYIREINFEHLEVERMRISKSIASDLLTKEGFKTGDNKIAIVVSVDQRAAYAVYDHDGNYWLYRLYH